MSLCDGDIKAQSNGGNVLSFLCAIVPLRGINVAQSKQRKGGNLICFLVFLRLSSLSALRETIGPTEEAQQTEEP